MTVLHLSDTHGKHFLLKNLPKADVIVHSGDVSENGTVSEVLDFLNWFCDLDFRYKIFVAGNHDHCLFGAKIEDMPENYFYLCNSGVTIDGVKFYGIPMFMENITAGNYDIDLQQVPVDTDILITHQPPLGILDFADNIHYGDFILLKTVMKIKPKFHLFGHIHNSYGIEIQANTTFANASLLNENYELTNQPFVVEL